MTERRRWTLSGEALDRLLAALDADREAASHKYEALRRRLIDLFSWEHSEAPEDLAAFRARPEAAGCVGCGRQGAGPRLARGQLRRKSRMAAAISAACVSSAK